jgi:hypothetical protein
MDIDPAWGDQRAVSDNITSRGSSTAADLSDLRAVNGDISGEAGLSSAIDNGATANHDIMHALNSGLVTRQC